MPNIVKLRLNLLKLFSENYRCFFLTRCSVYDHAVRESGVESHGIAGQCQAVDESSADWWICCTHLLWSATGRLHWPLVRRYAAVYWRRGWQREPGQRTCDYKTVIANSTYGLPRPAISRVQQQAVTVTHRLLLFVITKFMTKLLNVHVHSLAKLRLVKNYKRKTKLYTCFEFVF